MLLFSPALSLGARPAGSPPADLVCLHRIQTGVRRGYRSKEALQHSKSRAHQNLVASGLVANARSGKSRQLPEQGAHDDTAVNKGRFGTKAPFTSLTG